MKTYILPSIKLSLLLLVLCSIVYPLLVAAIGQAVPGHGNGATMELNGKIIGYELVGQAFTKDEYFWSRPSAVAYNAAGSGGSNKGPSNPDYLAQVQARIDTFLLHNPGIRKAEIPADLVTASGSGLDPHISPQAALVQVKRIAKLRNIPEASLQQLVAQHTEGPLLGLFGTSKVHVLRLNLALDQFTKHPGL